MKNIFILSEAQNNVFTKVISFCINLVVTAHDRVSNSNSCTTTIKLFPSSSTLCTLEPCVGVMFIKFHFMIEWGTATVLQQQLNNYSSSTLCASETCVGFVFIGNHFMKEWRTATLLQRQSIFFPRRQLFVHRNLALNLW